MNRINRATDAVRRLTASYEFYEFLLQNEQSQARAGISAGSGSQMSENEMFPQWHLPRINML